LLTLLGAPFASSGASAQNLLQNPSFEQGQVGFTSAYHYTAPVCCQVLNAGDYTVIDDPGTWNPDLIHVQDHSASGTKMLVVDGVPGITAWQESVSNLQPHTTYGFRFWWLYLDPHHQTPPNLVVQIDLAGTWIDSFSVQLPATVDWIWRSSEFFFDTQSSTSVSIRIIDTQGAQNGNDFALDDMELGACSTPIALLPLPQRTRGALFRDASITVEASSGVLLNYQWLRNGVPMTNGPSISGVHTRTLRFGYLVPQDMGSYSCLVSSSCGGTVSSTATQLIVGLVRIR